MKVSSVFHISKAAKIIVSHRRGHRNHEFGETVPRSVLRSISDLIFKDFRDWAVLAKPLFDAFGFQLRFGIDLASIFGPFSLPGAPPRPPKTVTNDVSDTLVLPPRFLHPFPGPKSCFLGLPGTDVGSILHAHRARQNYPVSIRIVVLERRRPGRLCDFPSVRFLSHLGLGRRAKSQLID